MNKRAEAPRPPPPARMEEERKTSEVKAPAKERVQQKLFKPLHQRKLDEAKAEAALNKGEADRFREKIEKLNANLKK